MTVPGPRNKVPGSRVESVLLGMAYDRLRLSAPMTAVIGAIMIGLLWPYMPRGEVLGWFIVIQLTAAGRYALWWFYQRAGAHSDHRQWQRRFIFGAVLAGASWGLGPLLLKSEATAAGTIVLVLTELAVSAVAMASLAAQPRAMHGFLIASLGPSIVALANVGGWVDDVAAGVLFLAMVSLMIAGRASAVSTQSLVETELELSQAIQETEAARARAEAASLAKSRFLANMSHELRTPLNAVIGAAQLLRAGGDDPLRRARLVDTIEHGGHNLLGLIENILDLSRIEAGETVLHAADFDLVGCVDAAMSTVALAAHGKHLRLAAIVDPALAAWRHGDAARLRQVLTNLLGNAVKFTARGEIVVRVGAGGTPGSVRIGVSDTGVGIGAASLAQVFEPFRQADDGADRRFGGSGLGLAIVHQLLQAMGGQISVWSELDRGSRFDFELPLPLAATPVPPLAAAGARFIFIEPHEASAEALQNSLARLGCTAQRCHDTSELRQALAGATSAADRTWVLLSAEDGMADAALAALSDLAPAGRVLVMTDIEVPAAEAGPRPGAGPSMLMRPVALASLAALLATPLPAAGEPRAPAPPVARAPRVLVVEDDPVNQAVVSALLEHGGCLVSVVSSGSAALVALRTTGFDLVLMDWQMPDMDGLEVTRRLRAGEAGTAGGSVPVVALTANAFAEDREACLAAGMDDFLSKPVLAKDLMAAVARWARTG